MTKNKKRTVDVGTSDYLFALYSTIYVRCANHKKEIKDALAFFESGKCEYEKALETARQINVIRDLLSAVKIKDMVYDCNEVNGPNPLVENLSPVVTSCSNLFLTKDGKDLLFEIVSILTYGYYLKTDVEIIPE